MKKSFIITVDTEGDNLWNWKPGDIITTENGKYVDRFQELCDRFGFKPVYLTNYEMANDDNFISKLIHWEAEDRCEIGIHLHAWNTPPFVNLCNTVNYNGGGRNQDYLIEYSEQIMRDKFKILFDILCDKIGHRPVSHRAGRWAMDDRYFRILNEFGITTDCSFTPGINWESSIGSTRGGSDYTDVPIQPHFINGILEVPVSIRKGRAWGCGTTKHKLKSLMVKHPIWLRPSGQSIYETNRILEMIEQERDSDYAEFMIHSSELMPSGSPYFKTNSDIDRLYVTLERIFLSASKYFSGITLREYRNKY